MILVNAGIPGDQVAAQITGATGGVFNRSVSGTQMNLNAPGSGKLEGVPFEVQASGWVKLPAGTYTATIVAALYGVAGSAAWTAAAGNQLAASTSISITQAGTTAVVVPFYIEIDAEGDSTSGLLQGLMWDLVNNVKDATNNLLSITHAPTGVNFQTGATGGAASGQTSFEPVLQFAAGVTLTNAQAGAVSNLTRFSLCAD